MLIFKPSSVSLSQTMSLPVRLGRGIVGNNFIESKPRFMNDSLLPALAGVTVGTELKHSLPQTDLSGGVAQASWGADYTAILL